MLARVPLVDEAMAVSAVWGRSFESGGKSFGHVLDARTGFPTEAALLSAVVLPSGTECDALSTALLTMGRHGLNRIAGLRKGSRCLVVEQQDGRLHVASAGISCVTDND